MIEIPNCFYRISVKALVLDPTRTKFLIAKEEKGVWELPGGGLEWGAGAKEELAREIREEMGLAAAFIADVPSYFLTCQNSHGTWIANLLFETRLASLDFTPSDECVEIRFVTPEEVARLPALGNVIELAKIFDPARHCA